MLRVGDMCRRSVRYGHGQRAGRPADDAPARGAAHRRAAHRAAHRHRHAGARAAGRAAADRRPAQRRHRRRHLGPGARHHRRWPCGSATRSPTPPPSCSWARPSPASRSSATRPPTSCCSPTSGGTTSSAAGSWPTRRSCRSTPTGAATSPTTRTSSGPNEPDLNLYNGYPITEASFRRKLWRDARGTSGWKNLKGLLLRASRARRPARSPLRILGHAAAADRWPPSPSGAGGSTRCCGSARG